MSIKKKNKDLTYWVDEINITCYFVVDEKEIEDEEDGIDKVLESFENTEYGKAIIKDGYDISDVDIIRDETRKTVIEVMFTYTLADITTK